MKRLAAILLTALVLAFPAGAKITLPHVLGDHMVLQRNADVRLWGWADPGATVTVTASWRKGSVSVKTGADGRWECRIPTGEAGGPYTLTFREKGGKGEEVTLRNILLGEVWLCSGQSNMEMPVKGFDRQPNAGGNDLILKAKPSVPIRMFVADTDHGRWIRQWDAAPRDDIQGRWFENTPEGVAFTSAVAYNFARKLQEVLDVPVGIIVSTLGGSRIETWMSREAIRGVADAQVEADLSRIDTAPETLTDRDAHNLPTLCYNAKIAPMTPFTLAGFLWYQGESNIHNPERYAALYEAMVSDWRRRWGLGGIPFYCVQIAPFNYDGDPDGIRGALIREAQEAGARAISNGGIVTTLDIGAANMIHPLDKVTVGSRLALLALGKHYGYGDGYFICESPVYRSMKVIDGDAHIYVENTPAGLYPMWTDLGGFEVAGEDRVFHPAVGEIDDRDNSILLRCLEVSDPVAVRYGFHNWAEATVFNTALLPLLPFRTDRWD